MVAGKKFNIVLHIIFILMAVCCLFPILLTLSISLSSNKSVVENGYQLLPRDFSLEAYRYIFMDSTKIIRAYGVTIFNAVVGGTLSVLVIAHVAYPLSRSDFKLRKPITYYILFTMLFSGGQVASYMVITTIYHLQNTIWVMILPCMMSPWYVVVLRTFFKTGVPTAIIRKAGRRRRAADFVAAGFPDCASGTCDHRTVSGADVLERMESAAFVHCRSQAV